MEVRPLSFTTSMCEKNSYDYIYVDEKNMVHLLCPMIGGDTIGIDNTCKSTMELKRFFGLTSDGKKDEEVNSATKILAQYISDLKDDIDKLKNVPGNSELLQKKKERLQQLEQYLECLTPITNSFCNSDNQGPFGHYPKTIKRLIRDGNNCCTILLSPSKADNYVNFRPYTFSINNEERDEGVVYLSHTLRETFNKIPYKKYFMIDLGIKVNRQK